MGIKVNNPKLTQKQIAKQVTLWDCTIERYRIDKKISSLSNTKKTKKETSGLH